MWLCRPSVRYAACPERAWLTLCVPGAVRAWHRMGVVGGHNYTPEFLKEMLDDLKAGLTDKSLPFGVDLLLPKVGEATLTLTLTPNLALTLTLTLALTRTQR